VRASLLQPGLMLVALLCAVSAAQDREVFVDARPRRQAPLWYDNLPAWKQAYPLQEGLWVIGVADKAPSEAAARQVALANARAACGLAGEEGAKVTLVEEDSYLRIFGPDAQTPKWYYLAVLYRAPAPPSPVQAYQEAMRRGRQALNDKRLLDARTYFLAAEALRRGRDDLPPVVELQVVEAQIKSHEDLVRAAEQAARRRATEEAIATFAKAAERAEELNLTAAAAYARMRIEELKRGEFDRWVVFVRESMIYKDEGGTTRTETGERTRTAWESFLAGRRIGVVSLDVAGLDERTTTAEVIRRTREHNASILLLGRLRAEFRTWNPAQPYSNVRLPTAKGQGNVEIIDLRSGEVIWKQQIDASGFGQATEREACEDALANLARRATILLERDAARLGL